MYQYTLLNLLTESYYKDIYFANCDENYKLAEDNET